jgi:hypothetical protein
MQKISHETSGDYFLATLEQAPRTASKIMQSMQLGKLTSSFKVDKEYYPLLLMCAIAAFCFELLFGRWEYAIRAILVLISLTAASATYAEESAPPAAAPAAAPADPSLRAVDAYNEGLKALTGREANKAAELFQEAATLTKDPELKKKSLFNLGNTYMRMMDPGQAIQSYQAAHDVANGGKKFEKEANQRISDNLLLAVELEEKMKQMQQQQQQQQQGGEGDKQQQQQSDQKGPQKDYQPQYFNESQKQRMYDLMASEEQQIMQRLMQEKGKKPQTRTTDKPW